MKKRSIEDMQRIAKVMGGKCLSNAYMANSVKLNWQCVKGHVFFSKPNDVQQGHWCPECAKSSRNDSLRDTIENMQNLAAKFRGFCLSSNYKNSKTKLEWQCKEGHNFEISPVKVKKGHWCLICRGHQVKNPEHSKATGYKSYFLGINERICRVFFENIFQKKFPKSKPDWLTTPKGTRLELDGYCEEEGVAFEYQGAQHYRYVKIFHKTRDLETQKIMDQIKREVCVKNNVCLIEI